MKKRLLLCVILALLLTVPAFASGEQYNTRIDALCNLPNIVVTVPASAEVFINPFQLPIDIEADQSSAQIVSTPACIENKSEVPLSITVAVTGSIKEDSDMTLATSPTEGAGSRKRAFVYFEIQASSTANPPQSLWADEYDVEQHIIVRTTTKTKKNIVTLDAADGANHFGAFRLSGDCTTSPKGGWAESDGIDVKIAFTFSPLARPGI